MERAMALRLLSALFLSILLGGCSGVSSPGLSLAGSNDPEHNPYPANYKAEMLAFMHTYLNVPEGVREASIAEPAWKNIGGKTRYVVCLRYNAQNTTGEYDGAKDRAAVFYQGRFDQFVENGHPLCEGAKYQPFPELEHLSR
jgi:hypothetical protein